VKVGNWQNNGLSWTQCADGEDDDEESDSYDSDDDDERAWPQQAFHAEVYFYLMPEMT